MILKKYFVKEKILPFLIIGLGNPGREYENTRHNIGFLVVDQLAKKWGITLGRIKSRALMGESQYVRKHVVLIKPQTYMNNSGQSVAGFVRYYKPPLAQLLVVFDDLDLPFGSLRFKQTGGSSGQKGMQSIIDALGQDGFPRLRVGVGRPPGKMDASQYILKPFRKNEKESLETILHTSSLAIETFISDGLEKCMTVYNRSHISDG